MRLTGVSRPAARRSRRGFPEASDRLAATLDVEGQRYTEMAQSATDRIEGTLNKGADHIDERLTTMNTMLGIGLESVSKTIEGKATGLAAKLREAVANAAIELDAEALKAGETLDSVGSGFAGRMDSQARDFARTLDMHVEERTAHLAAHAENIASSISARRHRSGS